MDNLKCEKCGWWKLMDQKNQQNGNTQGRCHSRPPTATAVVIPIVNSISSQVTPQIIEVTVWPVTPSNCDACGDFEVALVTDKVLARNNDIRKLNNG